MTKDTRTTRMAKNKRQPKKAAPKARASRKPLLWGGALVVIGGLIAVLGFGSGPSLEPPKKKSPQKKPPLPANPVTRLRAEVVARYPHARNAFTQGLLWYDGHLYESTGLHRRSSLRRVHLESGEVLKRHPLPSHLFAEGLARVGDHLYQLTWRSRTAYVWTVNDFTPVKKFSYTGEGWGLCYDGRQLVMSDGSDRLTFRNPETFSATRTVRVLEQGKVVSDLNELECVEGSVWANIWQKERLVRIDPTTGKVTATVDARGLLRPGERAGTDVLNGIAWWPERRRFLLTGKHWPYVFEVEFVPE